jgi:hypothetical protein
VSSRGERARSEGENRRLRLALVREGRLIFLAIVAFLLVAGGIGTFLFFRQLAYGELVTTKQKVTQLQTEGENLKKQSDSQSVEINSLQLQLKQTKDELESIRPSRDRYSIPPNESRVIAGGRLIIGLIGAPANESITLSINGKQQTAVVGQQINVAPDASTNCQLTIQSFDMFKALIVAKCEAAKAE